LIKVQILSLKRELSGLLTNDLSLIYISGIEEIKFRGLVFRFLSSQIAADQAFLYNFLVNRGD